MSLAAARGAFLLPRAVHRAGRASRAALPLRLNSTAKPQARTPRRLRLNSREPPAPRMAAAQGGGSHDAPVEEPGNRVLSVINDATKWVVSGFALAILVYCHDIYASWAFIGSIVAAANCKLLKKIINQERPSDSWKPDPGMPSSHAQSLFYLGSYGVLALLGSGVSQATALGSAALMATAFFLTWLRVELGFHTAPQVVVGGLVGIVSAQAWSLLGNRFIFPHANALQMYVYAVGLVAVVAFGVVQVAKELKERKELRKGL